jgi:hypothetical protein
MKTEIFTLGLYSEKTIGQGGFVVNNTARANITYQIDFNALFQGRENNYSKCRVRGTITTNNMAQTALDNTTGYIGVVGFSDTHRLGLNATYIMMLDPTNSNVTGTTGFYYFNGSAQQPYGSEINIPKNTTQIQVQFLAEDGNLLSIAIAQYFLMLQFELFNDE